MFVATLVMTILLLIEVVPSAVVNLTRAQAGLTRLDKLTRLGVLQGRNMWVVTVLGVLHSLGIIGVLVGLGVPLAGVGGAAVETGAFGWILLRQLRAGDRGRELFAYGLFTSMALVVLVLNALR
ncbi:hypothetical protein [Amycolatopsis taiwanensis]|uniref:hypothetical protein n=1 Tax=Amycolatopsis taiwanensis TaxID=342230 RepID=UPI0004831A7F|nr:hypothetical protein [Amycolatopsis taiwanensis]